jgi:hypothetical protein
MASSAGMSPLVCSLGGQFAWPAMLRKLDRIDPIFQSVCTCLFTAAQAAQKKSLRRGPLMSEFTAAQAAQKFHSGIVPSNQSFTAAQAAQKLWRLR